MAWIIGHVTKDELDTLRNRGWVDEAPPKELLPEQDSTDPDVCRMFFVDNDVFSIMSGPDWDLSEKDNT